MWMMCDCGVALASLVITATNSSYAQNENYRAKLDGNKEVPPVKQHQKV